MSYETGIEESDNALDADLELRRKTKYYTTRTDCAKGAKQCRIELGGNDYEEWYYSLFSRVCFELKAAQERGDSMVSDWAIHGIAQEAIKHVKIILERHAEVNS